MTVTTEAVPAGLLYQQAAEYQARVAALEGAATARLADEWQRTAGTIQGDLDAFLDTVAARRAAGQPTSPSWAYREARYRQAIATAQEQAQAYGNVAAAVTTQAQGQALTLGAQGAASVGSAAVASAGIAATFVEVNPDVLRQFVGFTEAGTPLADLFAGFGAEAAERARQAITVGLVTGKGVDRIRRDFLRGVDTTRARAERIVRTETHRAFRAASRETYMANADVLEGWVWTAALSARTCPGCMAMHGTVMPVTETLDGHPNCRCAMVPRAKDWAALGVEGMPDTRPPIQTGEDWLREQSERVQRAVLGPRKFDAWKAGQVSLRDMVTRTSSPQWGTMRREATLAEALAAASRNGHLPDWAAPYEGRLVVTDPESPVTRQHLEDLGKFAPGVHRRLSAHFQGTPGGGFYIGDKAVPDLDDLGFLRGERPRGWGEGHTWDTVPGAYSPLKRVCACGGGGHGHGAVSLALHEGSHALDDALGGLSSAPAWRGPFQEFAEWVRPSPYLRPGGNPDGWASELFAEGFASFSLRSAEGLSGPALHRAMLRDLGGATDPRSMRWAEWMASNFRKISE